MATGPLVLVVEDEKAISELIAFHLEQIDVEPNVAPDARTALSLLQDRLPALVILDIMLPDMDGLEILRQVRRDSRTAHIPVILLTARAEEADRILGLEIGADDYVVKPFSPRELMLRVKRLLATRRASAHPQPCLQSGLLTIDESQFVVTVNGEAIEVSATEMRLLSTLIRNCGTVFSRSQLLQHAWGYMPNVTERTIDTHVKRLRQKLGPAADYVETVRGVGYRWAGPAPAESPQYSM